MTTSNYLVPDSEKAASSVLVRDTAPLITRAAIDIGFLARANLLNSHTFGIGRVMDELLHHLPDQHDFQVTLTGICNFDGDLFLSSALTTNFGASLEEEKPLTIPSIRSRLGMDTLYRFLAPAYITCVTQKLQLQHGDRDSYFARKLSSILLRSSVKALKTLDMRPRFDQENYDVFFSTYWPLPPKNITGDVPRVIQIFDLIPVLQPHLTSSVQTDEVRRIVDSINVEEDWIICNAQSVRGDICRYTGIDPERVMVVPLAAAEHFSPDYDEKKLSAVRKNYGIPSGPFLLSVAAWQPRKNIPHLVRSFLTLLEQHPELDVNLVLVGNAGSEYASVLDFVRQSKFEKRLIFTGYVPERDISTIYSAATAFIFPSISEGFGLPPLEAMCCGTPVVCSNTTSLPEVVGEAALMIDPTDSAELSQALWRISTDEKLRSRLQQEGLQRSRHFSWARYSSGIAECLRRAATGVHNA